MLHVFFGSKKPVQWRAEIKKQFHLHPQKYISMRFGELFKDKESSLKRKVRGEKKDEVGHGTGQERCAGDLEEDEMDGENGDMV